MLIKTSADKEKVHSILKMVETTLQMIDSIDYKRFSSNVAKEYYDAIRELISVVLLLDGYKTSGDGAHRELIEYLSQHYSNLSEGEIILIDELRTLRHRITYDGFFINSEYLDRNKNNFSNIIKKLKDIIKKKMR